LANHVYFFSTCLVEHLFPKVGLDGVALLERFNFDVVLPSYPTCCAQPAYNSGATEQARTVAKNTIDILSEQNLPVIVPSASCADMLQHHYPILFADDPHYSDKAHNLAQRCHELVQFLSPHLNNISTDQSNALGIHISCSARRGTLSTSSWNQAAQQLSTQVCEPAYAQECCGFGGTFAVKAPEISSKMAHDKLQQLSTCGAHFVTGDCGCLMHLNTYAEKHGLKIRGEHLISALAEHYGINNEK